jgi:hypothetical protein
VFHFFRRSELTADKINVNIVFHFFRKTDLPADKTNVSILDS